MGQGMQLGRMSMKVFPETQTLHVSAGKVLYIVGCGVAIAMWKFGLVWLFFALGAVLGRGRPAGCLAMGRSDSFRILHGQIPGRGSLSV
ncbi:hypothetical protein P171DRAFT_504867 [Karstenula rhodostoma CBS 690.94]|uniref:Uncharacterized protein n=1 Tax=Karstenula rhodostoma CBS 690.94 TaxID=1392251 RepID=A0A9P4U541_9PLEO|nr:hypothetical protein P171DRAFT_504867 [Karstenula rhodostoma CBS 690.94]